MGKKISLGTAITLILIAITITFTFAMVLALRNFNNKVSSITERENMFAKFTEIDNYVRYNHGEAIDEATLMDAVAKGYLSGINDPYAKYMNAAEYSAFIEASGKTISGVGIICSMDSDGYMYVDNVYEGSTAASAGIVPGDLIIKVDDINLSKDNYSQAEALLTGDAGTKVSLTVRRDSEDTVMEITRRVLVPTTVFTTTFSDIHYIRINDFSEGTPDQFSKAVEKAISAGAPALVIDVRSVNTGTDSAAAEMIDKFAPAGDILYVEYQTGNKEVLYTSNSRDTVIPTVVLVNEMTSGPAEFFAAGLRDFGIASIVGSQSAGYGSLQQIFKLDDGSAIQLTIGKYYLSNSNTSWEGIGITPDYIVAYDYTTLNFSDLSLLDTGVDVQLSKAIEIAASSVVFSEPEESENSEETSSEG
ncbi:MAG: PDZ domain-containing protein [Oscillospiraceae bacterium]|nr:PDZ domain-containing protein [Oscillospiraceae bacterium]